MKGRVEIHSLKALRHIQVGDIHGGVDLLSVEIRQSSSIFVRPAFDIVDVEDYAVGVCAREVAFVTAIV